MADDDTHPNTVFTHVEYYDVDGGRRMDPYLLIECYSLYSHVVKMLDSCCSSPVVAPSPLGFSPRSIGHLQN